MNSIIGFSELAQDGDISQETGEYLKNIQKSAKWLLNIINDILDISKIESGKIELESIPFELSDIFMQCQSAITPKAMEKGLDYRCNSEFAGGKKLLGDPVRLQQALINLLSNAVKFTHAGEVKLTVHVENMCADSIAMNFEVSDSGIGMTGEQMERIFEPFVQADDSVTRRFGGTGLGLTITKNIIELMGGELAVESLAGAGSKFSFKLTFDFADDTACGEPDKSASAFLKRPSLKGEVLICEDNGMNQRVICHHLAKVGLTTVVAQNGKEGADIVAERARSGGKPFDLIFMDIYMPVMDGLSAASEISAMGVKTPIVALTANVMPSDLSHYRECGMSDCIGKPFVAQELWRCLLKFIPVDPLQHPKVKTG